MTRSDNSMEPAPDVALALAYAPPAARAALAALFALDATLGRVIATTTEPMVGQMRMSWWHDALTRLDTAPPPAEPVLRALAAEALPRGATGAGLARLVEGWEELLDPDAADGELLVHAAGRGGGLFDAAAAVLGARGDPVAAAGEGWALADLARHRTDALALRAAALAEAPLSAATRVRWSAAGRPLGALAHLARIERAALPPLRAATRMLWFRTTGR